MYSDDFSEKIQTYKDGAGTARPWAGRLQNEGYIDGYEAAVCPTYPTTGGPFHTYGINRNAWVGTNNTMSEIYMSIGSDSYLNMQGVDINSEFVLLADSIMMHGGDKQAHQILSASTVHSGPHLRHGVKADTLFADGHVSALTKFDLVNLGFLYGYNLNRQAW
jgi:prepilin-type processing-associated H-X9-DG protein